MAEQRDDSFLARWSRRKHAARTAAAEEEPPRSAAEVPTRPADAHAAEREDAANCAPALPDPATLDASSDFSVFLGKDVPVETQRAALRRLWRLDPIYNRIDGLDDYCADFTDQVTVVRGLRTAYRVGRGLLERTGEPAAPAAAAPPASAASGPATEATLAPAPEAQTGGQLTPPGPASHDARSTEVVPPGESDTARAQTRPKGGDGGHDPGRRRLPRSG